MCAKLISTLFVNLLLETQELGHKLLQNNTTHSGEALLAALKVDLITLYSSQA